MLAAPAAGSAMMAIGRRARRDTLGPSRAVPSGNRAMKAGWTPSLENVLQSWERSREPRSGWAERHGSVAGSGATR
jgi:hypothetical protein